MKWIIALILITGAAGFIGSNVARALSLAGHDVVACDRLGHGTKWRNILGTKLYDIIRPEALPDWLYEHSTSIKHIIHLGAVSDTTEVDVDRIVRNNIRLSLDLWKWSTENRSSFIYASSAATYGDGSLGFLDNQQVEALARLTPLNAYGWSKQFVDCRIMSDVELGRPSPPQWVGLKLFNVYGPGEDHKGEMRSLITKILPVVKAEGCVKLFKSHDVRYTHGEQLRDFVSVADVVSVIQFLIATPSVSGLFNVGSGIARSWNDVVSIASACFGHQPRIDYVDMPMHLRSQYQYFTQAPMEKLRAAGWRGPTTLLEQGIADYINGTR